MKCDSVRKQLTAYLDGELAGDAGSAIRGHLRGCDDCRRVASDEATLRDGLRALPPLDPPARLWSAVQERLAAAEVADAERPGWRRVLARWAPRAPQLGMAGALVAAAIVLVVLRVQHGHQTTIATPEQPHVPVSSIPDEKPTPPPPPPAVTDSGDVTAALAAAPAQRTEAYAQEAKEQEQYALRARASWSDEQKQQFDAHVATLRRDVDHAKDEVGRQRAYRTLARYLQRAAVRNEVALAGGVP
jgi:hypothetical protein